MLRRVAVVRTDATFSVRQLLVTANVVPGSPIFVTLLTEAIPSSETSVLTIATLVTSQKTVIFMVTALKTSNLTEHKLAGLCSGEVICPM
jgi:hypothetical protein